MGKTWTDTKGIVHEYVPDAYYSFRQAWKKRQAAKVTMADIRTKLTKGTVKLTKPMTKVEKIQSWARSQSWSSYK